MSCLLDTRGMKDPEVLMPIECPECRQVWLEGFPVALVAEALLSGNSLRIRSRCHSAEWCATAVEMGQLRQYLSAGCIGPRNASGKYAAGRSANTSIEPLPRRVSGYLPRPDRPTYTRLAGAGGSSDLRKQERAGTIDKPPPLPAARGGSTQAGKVWSILRRLWVFDVVFLRRGR